MKQVFLLFIVIIGLIPSVYADDEWIDGITYRLGVSSVDLDIDYKSEGKKYDMVGTSGGDNRPVHLMGGSITFPIVIEFKEQLMNSWSYRQPFIDWTFNSERKDLYPNSESDTETVRVSTTKKYLRQSEKVRTALQNSFFNSSEKDFTSANSNWALSADVNINALMIGYSWGIFYPAFNGSHRWWKLGVGLGAFAAQLKIDYNLCSRYQITVEIDSYGKEKTFKSGTCIDKFKIDELETQGSGAVGILSLIHI